jgi:C1A family cysteine protease
MRHLVNILFGSDLCQASLELKKYLVKYGAEEIPPYFTDIHWQQDVHGNVSLSKVIQSPAASDVFIAGLSDEYEVEFKTDIFRSADKQNTISLYFNDLYNETMVAGLVGDFYELIFCLWLPLYDKDSWVQAQMLISCIKALPNANTEIDVIGFDADMADVIVPPPEDESEDERAERANRIIELRKTAGTTVRTIVDYKKEHNNISHFIVMQNKQPQGISLNLNQDSFVRVLGEFAMMCIENYHGVFGVVLPEKDLQAFGLSTLHFDKYYFLEYLLHKTYAYAMEREKIHEKEIDVNMAFNRANALIKNRVNLLSEFIKKEVLPRLKKEVAEPQIVEEVTPLLEDVLLAVDKECDDIITENGLSIPAKRAILTALLGYDDEFFINNIYNEHTLVFDDLESEAVTKYIEANNALLKSEYSFYAALSRDGQPVSYPLKEMKRLRIEMQRRVGYIRELEFEERRIDLQKNNFQETKKCRIEEGYYYYGEEKYRLLPQIEETPLTETYVPHVVKALSVDLSKKFTKIKNQGQQGSCTAHALTSIFEYMLKSGNATDTDLSEAFLHYNARQKVGSEGEDVGSNYTFAIETLVESGICEEQYMPYNEDDCTTPPSPEAIDNGRLRKVKVAKNVNRNLKDIKSALEDGCPVAVSLALYDSFGEGPCGIVTLPTEEEFELDKHGRHAMVICGYDDDTKFFLVRNSWGTHFGERGYCYLPYSYITNENLCLFAAIITEIETAKKHLVVKRIDKTVLNLFQADDAIRLAVIRNQLSEENLLLEDNQLYYKRLRTQMEFLKNSLKNANLQARLRDGTKMRLEAEIEQLKENYSKTTEAKFEALKEHDSETAKKGLIVALVAIGLIVVEVAVAISVGWGILKWGPWWYTLIGAILISSTLFLYFPYRYRLRKQLKEYYNTCLEDIAIRIAHKEEELKQSDVVLHVTGEYLSRLFRLQSAINSKLAAITYLLDNLKRWYEDETAIIPQLSANTQAPFIPLLNNNVLLNYFEQNKNDISAEISLCEPVKRWAAQLELRTVGNQDLVVYQTNIKTRIVSRLQSLFENFNVYDYLHGGATQFDFLEHNEDCINEILPNLNQRANYFLCDNGAELVTPVRCLFINRQNVANTQWYQSFFAADETPIELPITSPYKLMLAQLADLELSQI